MSLGPPPLGRLIEEDGTCYIVHELGGGREWRFPVMGSKAEMEAKMPWWDFDRNQPKWMQS